jgi:hypothetical protein
MGEAKDLRPYVDTMPGEEILELAPASHEDLARKMPKGSQDNGVWTRFFYSYKEFMDKELEEWALRVINRARARLEKNGPMQRSMF